MSTHEQHTPTVPTSAVWNIRGRSGPKGLEEPTPDEVLRELCDKNYHQLLSLIAKKMQKEKEQQDKLNAVKARLLYGNETGKNQRNHEESHYSESKTPTARTEPKRRHGNRRSRSPSPVASVFKRLKQNRPPSPRPKPRKEGGVFNRLGGKEGSASTRSDSRHQGSYKKDTELQPRKHHYRGTSSQETGEHSETKDSEGGHWKTRIQARQDIYGSGNPKIIKLFQQRPKKEKWAMPTWCYMFNSTLTENPRVWFDKLPRESIDSYKDLRTAFRENYLQQTKHIKDPVEIHHIKQRYGESTEDFMEIYKAEILDVEGAPECMKISGFMHVQIDENDQFPCKFRSFIKELKQNDKPKAPKKGETARKDKPLAILMIQPWERVAKQRVTQSFSPETIISFLPLGDEDRTEGPMIIEAEIGGHFVHRIYVDGGASSEILYEHCFVRLQPEIRSKMVPATTHLIGFSGETIWPLGQISLLVKIGDEEHSTSAWMNFMVIKSPSQHNGIIGRPGIRKIRVVPSTTHGMLKFTVEGGTVTLQSNRVIPMECAMISRPSTQPLIPSQVLEEKVKVAIHPEYPKQTIAIGSTLTEKGCAKLCALLRQSLDVFAWRPADITGVPWHIAEHRLNIREGCLPIKQKKRGQAPKRNKAIQEEVEKLVDVGIMKEVHYHSWLSNPAMVKKHDGSWRMCVDFKNLNQACPKDGYPLPEIDWKVESLCGYPFKCFLDAYKGYHQIKMAKEDEEKIAFITSQGIFCYSKMPFGLKNARATYQRLVDRADAVLSLPSPRCLKDVQKLNGKLASLNRFLSKSAEKSLPFFKTLKKCTKKGDFQWTQEAEVAFKQMKKLIAELPMLTAPKEKEELIMYLAAAKEAISAVLMTERGGKQLPVYFVSRALRGPEINYTPMEKLVLALLSASRRLKRYFQAHTIVVITDQPIKQLLLKSEISGRMLKWKFELEGYDIQYRPRTSIKGQILADFIVERPDEESPDELMAEPEELPEPWTLFTDGSSCIDGSGAGLILTNPEGVEFTYAMRFRFEATNNEAEYEALIAGLRIAEQMGVKNLQANVDSRLVANQVNGSYVAKESGMVQYLEKVKTLASNFKEFSIKQVPRSENKKADALSKIASTSFAHLSKQVLVEELKEKSIHEKEVLAIVEEEGQTWMTPICEYLTKEILPEDKKKARVVRRKASRYTIINGTLYKKSFLGPWLRCVGPLQANYVLREIHEGSCSMHSGPRSVVAKAIRTGYYWPTMHTDARKLIRECNDCQVHRPIPRNPQQNLTPITSPWPFYKWGIDIAGPFPEGPGKVKFLIVAIDYFTKWIEAKPVATITGNQVKKFVWDNIVCRFGLPGEIVSDNGKQFRDNPFKDWSLGEGIKARLDERSKDWIGELSHVLWAHRTMIKSSNRETPFSLTYGMEAVIPAEIGMPTLRTAEMDLTKNDEALGINLDLIEEKREQAAIQEAKSKAKMEKLIDTCTKSGLINNAYKRTIPQWNTVLATLRNAGRLDETRKVFGKMGMTDQCSIRGIAWCRVLGEKIGMWCSLITCYEQNGPPSEAIGVFKKDFGCRD
ncbi:reverse transcriptase domain-containing protein [Tanacetum coccineum]